MKSQPFDGGLNSLGFVSREYQVPAVALHVAHGANCLSYQ